MMIAGATLEAAGCLATLIRASLLCEQSEAGMACGQCKGCRLLASGSHPDSRIVAPEKAGKTIRVEQVRDMLSTCMETGVRGGHRVITIAPAHAMNTSASNALLKVLEEPPAGVFFLLLTDRGSKLLPTIKSRCWWLRIPHPENSVARDWLRQDSTLSDSLTPTALILFDGEPDLASAFLEAPAVLQYREVCQAFDRYIRGERSLPETSAVLVGTPVDELLFWMTGWLRMVMGRDPDKLSFPDSLRAAQSLAISSRKSGLWDTLLDNCARLQEGVPLDTRLLIEQILLKWSATLHQPRSAA
jgi:DNA polymerase-3 subunit delta'